MTSVFPHVCAGDDCAICRWVLARSHQITVDEAAVVRERKRRQAIGRIAGRIGGITTAIRNGIRYKGCDVDAELEHLRGRLKELSG